MKTIDESRSASSDIAREEKIKRNIILFFLTGITCFLAMFAISKSGIEDFTKFLIVLGIVCGFFCLGLYFIARIFFLCFKKP